MKTFHLTIAKVGENLFDGEAVSATLPGAAGVFTVLAHHEPLVSELKAGQAVIKTPDGARQTIEVEAGGTHDFSDYYSDGYGRVKFKDFLRERITFSYHNLVTDGVFGEMNLICCRNDFIYFDKTLQDHVLAKFTESLRHGGILALGSKESLKFTAVRPLFETVDRKQRIYRKTGVPHGI